MPPSNLLCNVQNAKESIEFPFHLFIWRHTMRVNVNFYFHSEDVLSAFQKRQCLASIHCNRFH